MTPAGLKAYVACVLSQLVLPLTRLFTMGIISGHAWITDYGCSEKEEEFQWLIKCVLAPLYSSSDGFWNCNDELESPQPVVHGIQISRLDHSLIFMSLTTIWFLWQVLTNSQCVETMGEADGSAIPTHHVADCWSWRSSSPTSLSQAPCGMSLN